MVVRIMRVSGYCEVDAEEVVGGVSMEGGEFMKWMKSFSSTSREFESEEEGVAFHGSLS